MERAAGTYGWVFGQVRVDPNDRDTVYFMGLDLNQSTDGGKTFKPLEGMHGDHHALWIDPANSELPVQRQRRRRLRVVRQGEELADLYPRFPRGPVLQRVVRHGHAVPRASARCRITAATARLVDLSRGRDKVPAVEFEGAPGGEGSTHAVDPNDPNVIYSSTLLRPGLRAPTWRSRWPRGPADPAATSR